MATAPAEILPACCSQSEAPQHIDAEIAAGPVAQAVKQGLTKTPKELPPWLFYDQAGSLLFEQITALPEYYLTRMERGLLAAHAGEMIAAAARAKNGNARLRMIELGAGSADKTRTLLSAAVAHQGSVDYCPVDVSATALDAARERIEAELPGVKADPVVADYTAEWALPNRRGIQPERSLLLWIGSSIGNFEPEAAVELLARINRTMKPGDGLLLGVDFAPSGDDAGGGKEEALLLAAYDDQTGVTAQFNRNLLLRLNRELGADFDPEAFAHVALWNAGASRMEMHLESRFAQQVRLQALGMEVEFAAGERLHTENSYKYTPAQIESLMARAGFPLAGQWLACKPADRNGHGGSGRRAEAEGAWFGVLLGRKP